MTTNRGDYSILALFSAAYVVVVYRFQTSPRYILLATSLFGVFYIIWGITHHLRANNFHNRIVLEYFLVAALGLAIVSTLLL